MRSRTANISFGIALMALTLTAVELSSATAATAKPRPENSAVIDFGTAYCDVAVHDVHVSQLGDVSSHSTVACFSKEGGGARIRVQQIAMTTTFSVLKLNEIGGGTIDTCTGRKTDKYSYELPCHVPWQGPGVYGAKTEARVTHGGQTLTASASNSQELRDQSTRTA